MPISLGIYNKTFDVITCTCLSVGVTGKKPD